MKAVFCLFALSAFAFAEDKPTLEEKIKDSSPLKLEEKIVNKGGAILQVKPIMMDKPFLTDWFADGPRSIKVEGDKLQAWFKARKGGDTVHAFKLTKGKVAYDATFGDKGIAPFDRKKANWKPREDFGDWGDSIVSRPVGKYIGKPDSSEEKEKGQQLKLEDDKGKEVMKLGFVDKDNDICFLHNFCAWKNIVVIVDGNCRKLCFWNLKGKHLFNIECRELGLDYPWVQAIDITEDGTMYLGFTQKRKDAKGGRNSDIQEAAFLKITGLDTIK